MAAIYNFLLRVDGTIYDLIDYVYDIFNYLAKLNIFDDANYANIVSRIYIILGMIMLFVLAYSLLKAVINPDDFAKGEHSFPKLIQNIVISLVIIAVLPTIFTVAFNVQNSILNNDTIPKLILGTDDYSETVNSNAGRSMAYYTFKAFFHPNEEWCLENEYISATATDNELISCSENIKGNGWIGTQNGDSLSTVDEPIKTGEKSFIWYNQFGEAVEAGEITYYCLISSVAGIFILYVLLNFCFDMAVRVIKLMFFQIIAPIPVVCRVIPFGGMKDVFKKWTKNTVSTFVEVFIRIAIMYLGVFLITKIVIPNLGPALAVSGLSFSQRLIVQALVIMGVVIFIKQAPKLIGDMFGLDSGSMKLGLMDKLAMGGGLMAGAAVGGLATTFAKNAVSGIKNTKKNFGAATGKTGKAKALLSGAAWTGISSIAGGVSGGARGLYGAKGAKNLGDMKSAASKAIASASAAKTKRDAYRASHQGVNAFDTLMQVGLGHVGDKVITAGEYLGFSSDLSAYQAEKDFYSVITAIDDNSDKVAADLLTRDKISGSAALMAAAGGPNISLDAMKERMELIRNTDSSRVIGSTVTDFNGNGVNITNENDYAQYLASMKNKLSQAERDMKKYLKQQGYQGEAGIREIERVLGDTLGSGEKQRMSKLASDRENIANIVSENQAAIANLNATLDSSAKQIDAINDGTVAGVSGAWNQMDELVTNVKNRTIEINSEVERLKRGQENRNSGGGSNRK